MGLLYIGECGGALVQHPPAPGGDGGTPGCYREHLSTQDTNTKFFTMENVLPKCKCGADVHSDYYLEPFYDDSGAVEGVQPVEYYEEQCLNCLTIEARANYVPHDHEDELPF